MALITAENRNSWQGIADECSKTIPSKGKLVKIVGGRKYKGTIGRVVWHGRDKYFSTQYETPAQGMLRSMMQTIGYRVGIETVGGSRIFCRADYCMVCIEN